MSDVIVAPPDNIRRLPFDGVSFIPWFAIRQHDERGNPVWPHPMLARAVGGGRCWLCGRQRGEQGTFLLSLRGALERRGGDPPSHWSCAIYAATEWLPAGRLGWFHEAREDHRLSWLSDGGDERRGASAGRVMCLWQTARWQGEARDFTVEEPSRVQWFERGRDIRGVPFDPESYLGSLAQRRELLPLLQRLRPWLP
jgi:hypothetical protein